MEDLTRRLPGSPFTALTPTSQAAGNQRHDNSLAQTAAGTEPASPLGAMPGEITVHEPPEITAINYDTPVLRSADGSHPNPDNADRSNPYTVPDGSGWHGGHDLAAPDVLPEVRGKPRVRFGEWNQF